MSGSETGVGVMTSREQSQPYASVGPLQSHQPQPQLMQNMRLAAFSTDGSAVYKPLASAAAAATSPASYQSSGNGDSHPPHSHNEININNNNNMVGGESMKKKRGRPRKYGPDGSMSLALSSSPLSSQSPAGGTGGGAFSPPPLGSSLSPSSGKKARGRPRGSSKKQQMEALGSAGYGFMPHVITVNAGEDVSSKIMSFSQHGPRAVCIISANGAISNVTLRQPATSGGTVTYEGRFEILSLSGSFLLTESGGQRSRTGGLSVSLSGPDGRVLGGGVAGLLTAASPVQVIVGSFVADSRKEPKVSHQMESLPAPTSNLAPSGRATGASSPTSRGTLSESSGGPGSPLNQSNQQVMSNMPWK